MILLYAFFKILLIILILLLVIIALILVIPFYYYIDYRFYEGACMKLRVKWAGLICLDGNYDNDTGFVSKLWILKREIAFKSKKNSDGSDKKKVKSNKDKKNYKRKSKIRDIIDKDFIEELVKFLKKIIAVIKPKRLNIKLLYGFYDPFITGLISGFTYYLESILPQGDYIIEPVFVQEVIDIDIGAEGKAALGTVLIETLKFILKKSVRKKLKLFKKAETFS